MADEVRKVIVTQEEATSFAIAGSRCDDPLQHRVGAEMVHSTEQPLIHMHLWNEECVGQVEAEVTVRGDPEKPVGLVHQFPDTHHQSHDIRTKLSEPIHHALQMRTPLQVRFCNAWQIASNYSLGIDYRGRRLLEVKLTGATVATPQPCPEDDRPKGKG